jgi:hypothetical protein
MRTNRFLTLAAVGLALAGFAAEAGAGGIKVTEKTETAANKFTSKVAYNDPQLLEQVLQKAVTANRAKIEQAVKQFLGKGDLIAKGVTLYDLNFRLGKPSVRFTAANKVELLVKGNYLYFHSTTPTALGKWADPAFEVHFDLRLRATLALPTAASPKIRVTSAVVDVPSLTIKPRNFTGGVATTVTAIVNFFAKKITGRDYIRRAADKYLRADVTSALNSRLGKVNQTLAKAQSQGFRVNQVKLEGGKLLNITMLKHLKKRPVSGGNKAK